MLRQIEYEKIADEFKTEEQFDEWFQKNINCELKERFENKAKWIPGIMLYGDSEKYDVVVVKEGVICKIPKEKRLVRMI